jgi:RNA polymerase sigma-70 factor (ECF subfamily)
MRRLPDPELIALARDGSREAAEVLFDRYWEYAWKTAYAVTADRTLADDAAQDAIADAFGALDRFETDRPFGPWLKRIAVNRAVDSLRRTQRLSAVARRAESLAHTEASSPSSEDELVRAVADAVGLLGPERRTVVVLRYWLDLPLDEIAGLLGLPVGTVASRLGRATEELRLRLQELRVR